MFSAIIEFAMNFANKFMKSDEQKEVSVKKVRLKQVGQYCPHCGNKITQSKAPYKKEAQSVKDFEA